MRVNVYVNANDVNRIYKDCLLSLTEQPYVRNCHYAALNSAMYHTGE